MTKIGLKCHCFHTRNVRNVVIIPGLSPECSLFCPKIPILALDPTTLGKDKGSIAVKTLFAPFRENGGVIFLTGPLSIKVVVVDEILDDVSKFPFSFIIS
jgi:hypothetical protein